MYYLTVAFQIDLKRKIAKLKKNVQNNDVGVVHQK